MKLCLDALKEKKAWLDAGFTLPGFDVEEMAQKTKAAPVWLHLGAGNIFRAFPAADLQLLLDKGLCDKGVIVAECFDGEIIDKAYRPFDSLSVLCVLKSDGTVDKKVIASVCEALRCDGKNEADDQRLMEVLSAPSLQMVSLTITEKGYAVKNAKGDIFPFIQTDIENGPGKSRFHQFTTSARGKQPAFASKTAFPASFLCIFRLLQKKSPPKGGTNHHGSAASVLPTNIIFGNRSCMRSSGQWQSIQVSIALLAGLLWIARSCQSIRAQAVSSRLTHIHTLTVRHRNCLFPR